MGREEKSRREKIGKKREWRRERKRERRERESPRERVEVRPGWRRRLFVHLKNFETIAPIETLFDIPPLFFGERRGERGKGKGKERD